MNWKNIAKGIGIILMTLTLVGCNSNGSGGSNSGSETGTVETTMNLSMAALYAGKSSKSTAGKSVMAANKILTGELLAENTTTDTNETFVWSAYLDESDLNITSNKTIALEPGDYRFSLLLSDENFQYVGEAVYEIVDGGQHSIPLTIKPVIGDTVVDVSVVGELAGYKFQYQTDELTDIVAPKLGVVVDGGAEELFTINKTTGLTDAYLNLVAGNHTIHLNLYDTNVQIGRSVPEQESINVVAGEPFSIDLIALHGEAEFIIDVAGGTATVTANIPEEVIDEIGLSNLQVILLLSDNNAMIKEEAMTLTTENNVTTGSVTLTDMQFGTYTMQLKFNNTDDTDVPVASCLVDSLILDKTGSTVDCTLTLQKRGIIGGNLLATVGVNVFNTDYEPIAGAKVYANDELIGLTGSGSFGTKGYLKMYHLAGDVTLKAEDFNTTGSKNVSLNPLDVVNHDIILDSPLYNCDTTSVHDIFGDGSAVATYTMENNFSVGEEATDLSGNYPLQNYNVTSSEDGKYGNGAYFNGVDARLMSAVEAPAFNGDGLTVSFWTDALLDGTVQSIIGDNDRGNAYDSCNFMIKDGQIALKGSYYDSPTLGLDGTLHHFVYTVNNNGSNADAIMYKDGDVLFTHTFIGKNVSGSSGYPLYITGNGSAVNNFIEGMVDQVRIFNRSLTQEEISQLYSEKSSCSVPEGLIASYDFEGNGNDNVGNYHMTSYGPQTYPSFDCGSGAEISDVSYFERNGSIAFNDNGNYSVALFVQFSNFEAPYDGATIFRTGGLSFSHVWGDQYRLEMRVNNSWINLKFNYASYEKDFVSIVKDGRSVVLKINDVLKINYTLTATETLDNYFDYIRVGSGNVYNAEVGRVKVFNKALSSAEITQLYNEACQN